MLRAQATAGNAAVVQVLAGHLPAVQRQGPAPPATNGPKELIAAYTTLLMLDEDELGHDLASRLTQKQDVGLAHGVFDALRTPDRDDVAEAVARFAGSRLAAIDDHMRIRLIREMVDNIVDEDAEAQITALWLSFRSQGDDKLSWAIQAQPRLWKLSLSECKPLRDEFSASIERVRWRRAPCRRRLSRGESQDLPGAGPLDRCRSGRAGGDGHTRGCRRQPQGGRFRGAGGRQAARRPAAAAPGLRRLPEHGGVHAEGNRWCRRRRRGLQAVDESGPRAPPPTRRTGDVRPEPEARLSAHRSGTPADGSLGRRGGPLQQRGRSGGGLRPGLPDHPGFDHTGAAAGARGHHGRGQGEGADRSDAAGDDRQHRQGTVDARQRDRSLRPRPDPQSAAGQHAGPSGDGDAGMAHTVAVVARSTRPGRARRGSSSGSSSVWTWSPASPSSPPRSRPA